MTVRSPLLDLYAAGEYLALPEGLGENQIQKRLIRLGVPLLRLGHGRAVRRADLDALIARVAGEAKERADGTHRT